MAWASDASSETRLAYSAPPSWGPLKKEVTRAATAGTVTPSAIRQILQHFVRANGGANQVARGGGGVAGQGKPPRPLLAGSAVSFRTLRHSALTRHLIARV